MCQAVNVTCAQGGSPLGRVLQLAVSWMRRFRCLRVAAGLRKLRIRGDARPPVSHGKLPLAGESMGWGSQESVSRLARSATPSPLHTMLDRPGVCTIALSDGIMF